MIAKRCVQELEIGSCGTGTVYLARVLTIGERVAVGRIWPDVLRDSPDLLSMLRDDAPSGV